jgi:hypothetical protein
VSCAECFLSIIASCHPWASSLALIVYHCHPLNFENCHL